MKILPSNQIQISLNLKFYIFLISWMNAESTQKSIRMSLVFQRKELYQNFQRDKANKINNSSKPHTFRTLYYYYYYYYYYCCCCYYYYYHPENNLILFKCESKWTVILLFQMIIKIELKQILHFLHLCNDWIA